MKRLLSMLLVLVLSVGILGGCQEKAASTQPAVQENPEDNLPPVEDDGVMKILLICHSLGVDSVFMFPDICKSEGVENMVVGFLYHSGCRVVQHVDYAKANARQYAYYEYDMSKDDGWQRADCNGNFSYCPAGAANDIYIEDGSIAQTLEFGISRHDWDMVILQGGATETADRKDSYYKTNNKELNLTGYIQELREYVLSKDMEPRTVPEFSWNMVWTPPKDPAVRKEDTNALLDLEFEGSELKLYEVMAKNCEEKVGPSFDWTYVFPNGTTLQNLKSSTWQNAKLYRDYAHGHARAVKRVDGREHIPTAKAHHLRILHLTAQQHQRDHDDVLGDGRAVRAGGVCEDAVLVLIQRIVAHPVDTCPAAGKPLETLR